MREVFKRCGQRRGPCSGGKTRRNAASSTFPRPGESKGQGRPASHRSARGEARPRHGTSGSRGLFRRSHGEGFIELFRAAEDRRYEAPLRDRRLEIFLDGPPVRRRRPLAGQPLGSHQGQRARPAIRGRVGRIDLGRTVFVIWRDFFVRRVGRAVAAAERGAPGDRVAPSRLGPRRLPRGIVVSGRKSEVCRRNPPHLPGRSPPEPPLQRSGDRGVHRNARNQWGRVFVTFVNQDARQRRTPQQSIPPRGAPRKRSLDAPSPVSAERAYPDGTPSRRRRSGCAKLFLQSLVRRAAAGSADDHRGRWICRAPRAVRRCLHVFSPPANALEVPRSGPVLRFGIEISADGLRRHGANDSRRGKTGDPLELQSPTSIPVAAAAARLSGAPTSGSSDRLSRFRRALPTAGRPPGGSHRERSLAPTGTGLGRGARGARPQGLILKRVDAPSRSRRLKSVVGPREKAPAGVDCGPLQKKLLAGDRLAGELLAAVSASRNGKGDVPSARAGGSVGHAAS